MTLDDIVIRRQEQPGLALKSDGYMTVALDTELTPDLEAEGCAREVVHHIQNLRKSSGYDITDRIHVTLQTPSPAFEQALAPWQDYIGRETLARGFEFKNDVAGVEVDANGHALILAIRRVSEPSLDANDN